jgi:hypothetical protein
MIFISSEANQVFNTSATANQQQRAMVLIVVTSEIG